MDAGYFIVEILNQALWREDSLAVAQGCQTGPSRCWSPCRHCVEANHRVP
jgi:hypothetical protein